MPIPEGQLEIWSKVGAQDTSAATYQTVKIVLESADAGYSGKGYKVFLQGSYGNDTNIRTESDVDVVICLDATFYHNVFDLPVPQQEAFHATYSSATYDYAAFKAHATEVLADTFGIDVHVERKAITIDARGNRRKADVIVATTYNKYSAFYAQNNELHEPGIAFWTSDGTQIINYPQKHSDNLTAQHQATREWLKPLIRILKNARVRLEGDNKIKKGLAPSYYIEGLLYNVPPHLFGTSYEATYFNCLNYLHEADRSELWCVNEQYRLLDGDPNITWNSGNCEKFIDAVIEQWNNWKT